jgi:hypothetical protein
MPNMWNLLVFEIGVEQKVLSTASYSGVNLDNKDVADVILVFVLTSGDIHR